MNETPSDLRNELDKLALRFEGAVTPPLPRAGVDYLPPSGKVVGVEEFQALLHAAADMWLTAGRFVDEFEATFPKAWGLRYCLLVNSGSSANLLALAALTSPSLGERALRRGDEVITAACGFPTTVAPAVQHGLVPVFVDVEAKTLNATVEAIEAAITPKTRAVMLAHTLGNPFRADLLAKVCDKHGLWLVEDCCDALGATIGGAHVGTFGDFATCSFYPAHHITMGEGGAVLTNDAKLQRSAMSFRDWGRDCWCPPGVSNTCKKRFDWRFEGLPCGFDHKYVYSHIGYNLKSTDFQAAVGLVQMRRMEGLIRARRENHAYLTACLKDLGAENYCLLPEATAGTSPSWFGYFILLHESGRRLQTIQRLEKNMVGTRLLFGGNLTRQPAFQGVNYRVAGELVQSDKITNDGFWIGIWPGLEKAHLEYMAKQVVEALRA